MKSHVFSPSLPRLLLKTLVVAAVFFLGVGAAICVLAVTSEFFPSGRKELANPAGNWNRAFVHSPGLFESVPVLAVADWPHTFTRPEPIGPLERAGAVPASREVIWSVDGSVIAMAMPTESSGGRIFIDAYDYKAHRRIPHLIESDCTCEQDTNGEIAALMVARGGAGPRVEGLAGRVDGPWSWFPWWGWVTPLGIVILGGYLAVKAGLRISPSLAGDAARS